MMNQMAADGYRVRKGWTMRAIMIGILGATLLVGLVFLWARSGNFGELVVRTDSAGMTPEQIDQALREFRTSIEAMPHTATDFAREMLGSNMLPFFLMSVFLVVFGEDLFSGTYRNALSYETDRKRYYLAKMTFSAVLTAAISLATSIIYALVGGVLFGFGTLTGDNLVRLLVATLILLPSQIAVVAFGQFLCALFKRGGAVVAAYLVTLILVGTILQLLSIVTGWRWLMLLDWNSVGKLVGSYWTMSAAEIAQVACLPIAATALLAVAGIAVFRKSDLTM